MLTPKKERFCLEILKGSNQSDAYRVAYDAENMTNKTINEEASRVMADDKVKLRIAELREDSRNIYLEKYSITLDEKLVAYLNDKYEANLKDIKEVIQDKLSELLDEVDSREFKRRRGINKQGRYEVLYRAGFKCQACGAKPSPDNDVVLHIDHIIPFSLGGTNKTDNLQVLCSDCNYSKNNRFEVNHNVDE